MKRNDLTLVLGVAGLAAAYYFYTQNSAQLAALMGSRYTPPVVPPGTPIDPRTLPGYQAGPDPIVFPTGALGAYRFRPEVIPIDPINRPGVVIDPTTGDPTVLDNADLSNVGSISYDF